MRLGDEMVGQLLQVTLAVATIGGLIRPGRDKSSDATTRFDDTVSFQLSVNLGDRIRIDAQVNRQLTDRRQLVANAELAGGDCKTDRPVKLVINRRWMFGVDLEHSLFTHCTTTMEQVKVPKNF